MTKVYSSNVDRVNGVFTLLQLCCDCAELDDAVDRIVSGRGVPDGRAGQVR